MCFSQVVWSLLLAVLLGGALTQVGCLDFNFSTFKKEDEHNLIITEGTTILLNEIQVTPDVANDPITNSSGRISYNKPFRLWSKSKKVAASFNTTFDLKITPDLSSKQSPVGEGMAFILAADTTLPQKSKGQWLGIVNASTNGSHQAKIVAVEFDTRKSYEEDIDDNHAGLDVNSIHSIEQVSLTRYGINLSETYLYDAIKVRVQYDGKVMSVSAKTNKTSEYKLISLPLELSSYLSEKVFVGFSTSTSNAIQINCLITWKFHSSDVADEELEMLWVWITVLVVLINKHRKQPEDAYFRIEDQIQGSSMAPQKFKFKDLRKATSNFNPKNKLGKGGFGTVYKGFLASKQEFIAEVTKIGSLHHRNLVRLIGWCYERRELLLVCEFMPNCSLDRFIYGNEELGMEEPTLGWERGHTIIYGVAQALDYLHDGCEKRVLHLDIKASNIMLDSKFNAKLGDFGLARTLQQSEYSHHTTKVIAGTLGYMAPETFLAGRATVETDIYAFGVLVLEVVSGRKPGNQNEQSDYNNNIVHWLWELHRQERILRPSIRTGLQVLTGEVPPPLVPTKRPAFVWPAIPPSFEEDAENFSSGSQLSPFTKLTGR
ncbi:hypothetical protein ACB094_11G171700 [Castanea mollissima]